MVANKYVKFVITKCECDRLLRGTEFKKHLKQHEGQSGHGKRVSFRACLFHKEVCGEQGHDEFYRLHSNCPSEKINGPSTREWLKTVSEEREAVDNLHKVLGKDSVDLDAEEDLSEEEEVLAGSIIGTSRKRKLLDELFGSDVSLPSPNPPDRSSTPTQEVREYKPPVKEVGGIREQCRVWDRDEVKAQASKQQAFVLMSDRLEAATSQNKALLLEKTRLEIQVGCIKEMREELEQTREREMKWLKERREMIDKIERFEKMGLEIEKQRQELIRLREERDSYRGMREENDRLKGEVKKVGKLEMLLRRKSYEVHIPLHNNNICDRPLIYADANETQTCFSHPERGINCLHIAMQTAGDLESFHARKLKFKLPSKYET